MVRGPRSGAIQDFEGRTGIQLQQSFVCRRVIGLQHDNDLQFLRRIVELAERRDEARHGARLVIERDHNGVDRQVIRSQAESAPASPPRHRADDAQRRARARKINASAALTSAHARSRNTMETAAAATMLPSQAARMHGGHRAAESSGRSCRKASDARSPRAVAPYFSANRRNRCGEVSRKRSLGRGCARVNQMARAENLRRHDIDKRVRDAQRQQAGFCRLEQPVIRQRAGGARQVEPLERHLQPSGERPHVIVLGKMPRRDQDLIGTDVERKRPLLGCGE